MNDLESFLKELSELKIKHKAKHFKGHDINDRLYLQTPDCLYYCPITFVNAMKNHHYYKMTEVYKAAEELGLDNKLTAKIVDAADNNCVCDLELQKQLKSIIEDSPTSLIPVNKI